MAEIAYRIEGHGPPVVLLHPVGLDGETWRPLSSVLATNFSVIRCDLPGHGQSSILIDNPTIQDYATVIARFIQHLNLGPVALLGSSFGGMIAQTVAVEWPASIRALMPVACPGHVPAEARSILQQRGSLAEEGGMQAILNDTLQRWFSSSFMHRHEVKAVSERLLTNDVNGWAAAWRAMSSFNLKAKLGSINSPTLCIAGSKDISAPVAAMEAIAEAVPNAELSIIDDAPHMVHIEYPDQLATLVKAFLDRILTKN